MAKANRGNLAKLLAGQFCDRRIVLNRAKNSAVSAVEIVNKRVYQHRDGSCAVMVKLESGERIRVTYQLV